MSSSAQQVGDELLDRTDRRRDHLLHTSRHGAVHRPEHLRLTGIDHRHDHLVAVLAGERQQVERRDPDDREPQRLGDRLGRRATRTRIPVNNPGPMSTATTPISARSTSAWRHTNSIAGARISAWRRPRDTSNNPITPSWPPIATPTRSVAVSIPRVSTTTSFRRAHPAVAHAHCARGPTTCAVSSRPRGDRLGQLGSRAAHDLPTPASSI